jgi:hypothetical protein
MCDESEQGLPHRSLPISSALQAADGQKQVGLRPTLNGPTPSPIRRIHQAWSNRESNPLCMLASFTRIELTGAIRLRGRHFQFSAGLPRCDL